MVERADIEAKVRQIEAAFDQTKENLRDRAVLVAIGVALIVAAAFVIGRRKGRSSTIVEVYEL